MANAMFDFITDRHGHGTTMKCWPAWIPQPSPSAWIVMPFSGIPLPSERIDPYFMLNAWPDGWFERYVQETMCMSTR